MRDLDKSKQTKVVLESVKRIEKIMDVLKKNSKKEPPFMTGKKQ